MRPIIGAALLICSISPSLGQDHAPPQGTSCADGCTAPLSANVITENEFVQVLHLSIPPMRARRCMR